jgi:hypothetical protein
MHRQTLVMIAAMVVVAAQGQKRPLYGGTMSYRLDVSTDLDWLQDPNDPSHQLSAASKTRSEMAVARETPLFRLTNTSQDADITSLSISLNDPSHVFDAMVIAEAPADLGLTVESPLDSVHGRATSPVVSFSFADRPLRPRESFAFWVDIDPIGTAPTGGIDFRNILWQRTGDSREDNALVQVEFDSALAKPVPFFEFTMSNRSYPSLRDDGTAGQSLVLPQLYGADLAGLFSMEHVVPVERPPLPEPNSRVLLATGLGLLALGRRRRP